MLKKYILLTGTCFTISVSSLESFVPVEGTSSLPEQSRALELLPLGEHSGAQNTIRPSPKPLGIVPNLPIQQGSEELKGLNEKLTKGVTGLTGVPTPALRTITVATQNLREVGIQLMQFKPGENALVERLFSLFSREKAPLINFSGDHPNRLTVTMQWWHCAFKTIDFLLINKRASEETVRNFFNAPSIMSQVVWYTTNRFKTDIEYSLFNFGSPRVSDHWYWPHLHECFNVLDENQKNLLEATVLLQFRHGLFRNSEYQHWPKRLSDFLGRTFENFKYLEQIVADLGLSLKFPNLGDSNISKQQIRKDVESMVFFINKQELEVLGPMYKYRRNTNQFTQLLESMTPIQAINILECIDKFMSPGIMKEFSEKNPDFEMRFKILQFSARVADLSDQRKGINSMTGPLQHAAKKYLMELSRTCHDQYKAISATAQGKAYMQPIDQIYNNLISENLHNPVE